MVECWSSCNRSLVRPGEILFSYYSVDSWNYELDKNDINKKGKPFIFPNSFILAIGYIHYSFHLPYRQTEGIIKDTEKRLPANPSYDHICKRINKLNIDIKIDKTSNDDDLVIAVNSTGIKVTNRGLGGWLRNEMYKIRKDVSKYILQWISKQQKFLLWM